MIQRDHAAVAVLASQSADSPRRRSSVMPVKIRMAAMATVGSVAIQDARKYMKPTSRTAATKLTICVRPPVAELSSVRDWLAADGKAAE